MQAFLAIVPFREIEITCGESLFFEFFKIYICIIKFKKFDFPIFRIFYQWFLYFLIENSFTFFYFPRFY